MVRPCRRLRLLVGGLVATAVVPVAVVLTPASASAADITVACAGDLVGLTFTLTDDCSTTEPLTVPDGVTLDGAGTFTITAADIGEPQQWNGAIVTNAPGATVMNVRNVTITGPATGFQVCLNSVNTLVGILFDDASGVVDNVTVEHIWQQQTTAPSCQTGRAIVARGTGTQRTVTITDTEVRDYQKNGMEARGSVTMNVSGNSTIGPPHLPMDGLIAQNGLVYVGASGTATGNTIYGSGDQLPPGPPGGGTDGTAVVLFGATNVTIDHTTITGARTDIGIAVVAGSTGIVISFNAVGRTAPDDPDPTGIGIAVDPGDARISATGPLDPRDGVSAASLICNTFSLWKTNVVGAIQMSCTPLPAGVECVAYSTDTLSVQGGTAPFTWSVVQGTLPPGLGMDPSNGVITGTPIAPGTYDFVVQVVDSSSRVLTATQPETITIAPNCPTTTPTTTPTTAPASAAPIEPITTLEATTTTEGGGSGGLLPPTGRSDRAIGLAAAVLVVGGLAVVLLARRPLRR
jgi:Putative Ig domain/Right handed beta helix region